MLKSPTVHFDKHITISIKSNHFILYYFIFYLIYFFHILYTVTHRLDQLGPATQAPSPAHTHTGLITKSHTIVCTCLIFSLIYFSVFAILSELSWNVHHLQQSLPHFQLLFSFKKNYPHLMCFKKPTIHAVDNAERFCLIKLV